MQLIRPENYATKPIEGKKVLVVGFSHWGRYSDSEQDSPDFTNSVMCQWVLDGQILFFNAIASYFKHDSVKEFWNSVTFANTLPTTVGDEDERYSAGTPAQRAAVPDRALRLIADLEPDRVFVFTKKGWNLWPDYTGTLRDGTLRVEGAGEYDAGMYRHHGGEAIAFGFPHPQFTPIEPKQKAVTAAMNATISDLAGSHDRS